MPGGSRGAAAEIAAWTSWAAASMFLSRVKTTVIWVMPRALAEVIESMPAIVENCRSRTVATAEAIVSGLAPGRLAATWMTGKSTFGRSLTGSWRYAMAPKMSKAAMTSVVMTGRRMKRSVFIWSLARGWWSLARGWWSLARGWWSLARRWWSLAEWWVPLP